MDIYIIETIYEDRIGYDSYATIPQLSVVSGKENTIKIAERIVNFYNEYRAKYPDDDDRELTECCIYPTKIEDDGEIVPDRKAAGQILIYNSQLQAHIDASLEKPNSESENEPSEQFEIWPANSDHSGYPHITHDPKEAQRYADRGYEVRSYMAYPVI